MPSFQGQDLSPEMLAFQLKLAGQRIKKFVFLSAGNDADKARVLEGARSLAGLGVSIYATEGTHRFLAKNSVASIEVAKIAEKGSQPNVLVLLEQGLFDLVVNVLTGNSNYDAQSDAMRIREFAMARGIPLITDASIAAATINGMTREISRAMAQPSTQLNMLDYFESLVMARGGWVDNHGHYDKAYLMTPATTGIGRMPMQQKWDLYRKLKEGYTPEDLIARISRCVEFRASRRVTHMRTMVDADTIVGLKCIEAGIEAKRLFAGKVVLEIGIQPLEGVLKEGPRRYVEKACGMADFIGGLPSRDHEDPEAHLDFIMAMGRDMKKRVDVHIEQKGVPYEEEALLLCRMTEKYGLQGRVAAVHAIISRKPLAEQREIAKRFASNGIAVIVCPGAEISMEQLDMKVQMSNSVPPVPLMMEEGVRIYLGSDNDNDPFMPVADGDPRYEARLLMDACRTYDLEGIAAIASDRSLFAA